MRSLRMHSQEASSGDDLIDHPPSHIGQAKVPARIPIRQPFVIQSEQMQDRRVQIVHVDFVLNGVMAILVGLAVADAAKAMMKH